MELLLTPFTVTIRFPVVAPAGTVAVIEFAVQLAMDVAIVPLNVTVLVPCLAPKFVPEIVTDAPTAPEVCDKLEVCGATVKKTVLLGTPLTVTTTLPVVAAAGTVATIEVALQLVIVVTAAPLKATVLVPWLEPKFVPVMVTDTPVPPDCGERLVMFGTGSTVKLAPLLATPPTVTITLPVVAPAGAGTTMLASFQLTGVAVTPLNVTVLPPCVAWNAYPPIVTDVPIGAAAGDKN